MTTNKNTLNMLLSILMAVLLFSFYYYFLKPIKDSEESLQSSISQLEKEKNAIEARLEAMSWDEGTADDKDLLIKLPKNRDIPMILQLLQGAELSTESTIQSIVFNDYDILAQDRQLQLPETSEEVASETSLAHGSEEINQQEVEIEEIELPVSQISSADVPSNLELLTLQVSVLHKDYDQLYRFIEEIEQSERIINIDVVQYQLPGETFDSTLEETVTSTIQITTFYLTE